MTPWIDQANRWPIDIAASKFGLETVRRGNDVSFICPACLKAKRHSKGSDRRKSAKAMPDNGWWCEPCGLTGDVASLVACVVTGNSKITKETYKQVRAACAAHGLCDSDGETAEPMTARTREVPPPIPVTELPYPCSDMLRDFWLECEKPTPESEAGKYLIGRGFDLELIDYACAHTGVRVSIGGPVGFAENWNTAIYPLVFPLFDWRGILRSVQGRAIEERTPKSVFPKGHKVGGLVFADALGLAFLQSREHGKLRAIVITEGATDTLKLAQCMERTGVAVGVLGYIAGSKSAIESIRWAKNVPVIVATDNDATGDKYAKEIIDAVAGRAKTLRVKARVGSDWCGMSDVECVEVFRRVVDVL